MRDPRSKLDYLLLNKDELPILQYSGDSYQHKNTMVKLRIFTNILVYRIYPGFIIIHYWSEMLFVYRENSSDTTMSEINQDLLELIFRYLDPASVKAASQVSR